MIKLKQQQLSNGKIANIAWKINEDGKWEADAYQFGDCPDFAKEYLQENLRKSKLVTTTRIERRQLDDGRLIEITWRINCTGQADVLAYQVHDYPYFTESEQENSQKLEPKLERV